MQRSPSGRGYSFAVIRGGDVCAQSLPAGAGDGITRLSTSKLQVLVYFQQDAAKITARSGGASAVAAGASIELNALEALDWLPR